MRETELAWAAGFWDGEGSAHVAYVKESNYKYIQASLGQSGDSGYELLCRFDKAVGGLGVVYGPRPVAKNQTLIRWQWESNGYERVKYLSFLLKPFLGSVKKEQFRRVLEEGTKPTRPRKRG